MELLVEFRQKDKNDQEFQYSSDKSSDRGAADPHLRESEFTEDQDIVDPDVYNKRNNGDIKRDIDSSDCSQSSHQDICDDVEQESPHDQEQIFCAFGNDRRIICKDPDDPGRDQGTDQDQKDTDRGSDFQCDPGQDPDRPDPVLAPVLGCQRNERVSERNRKLLDNEKDLVYGRCSGKGCLGICPEHDIVRHIDRISDNVLERDKSKHAEHAFIKKFIFCEKGLFHAASLKLMTKDQYDEKTTKKQ